MAFPSRLYPPSSTEINLFWEYFFAISKTIVVNFWKPSSVILKHPNKSSTLLSKPDDTRTSSGLNVFTLGNNILLKESIILDLKILESAIYINNNQKFEKKSLPSEINYSPVFDIVSYDSYNKKTNLIMGGNQYLVKPQFGRYDASKGWIFNVKKTNNKINFKNLRSLNIEGQIRKFGIIKNANKKLLITAINNEEFKFFEIDN